jgi:hypothetical protein
MIDPTLAQSSLGISDNPSVSRSGASLPGSVKAPEVDQSKGAAEVRGQGVAGRPNGKASAYVRAEFPPTEQNPRCRPDSRAA